MSKNKIEEMIATSESILEAIEKQSDSLESVLFKCLKLCRLRNDSEMLDWIHFELNGYKNETVNSLKKTIRNRAIKIGRIYDKKLENSSLTEKDLVTQSITELETDIASRENYLKDLHPPETFNPSIDKHSLGASGHLASRSTEKVIETYQDVLNYIGQKKFSIGKSIKSTKSLLTSIKSEIYSYVINLYYQLKFENITESIFQETKETVDQKLSELIPDTLKKFLAAYECLQSDNSEAWSQAMSSTRNVLKEFADFVFPAQKEEYEKRNGDKLTVTDDKYKNRLLAFVDKNTTGKENKFLTARTSDLASRIHLLNDILSKGTHVGVSHLDTKICVIDTYFLIGSLLNSLE